MIALLHMCGQKRNENIRMRNNAKYNSAQHTIALQNKKNATNWNQTRKSWLCTTPQEHMINNKFDFINVILPPKHYKKCDIMWKTKNAQKKLAQWNTTNKHCKHHNYSRQPNNNKLWNTFPRTYRATGAQSKINAHENAQSTMRDFQQNNDRNLDFLTFVSQHGIWTATTNCATTTQRITKTTHTHISQRLSSIATIKKISRLKENKIKFTFSISLNTRCMLCANVRTALPNVATLQKQTQKKTRHLLTRSSSKNIICSKRLVGFWNVALVNVLQKTQIHSFSFLRTVRKHCLFPPAGQSHNLCLCGHSERMGK